MQGDMHEYQKEARALGSLAFNCINYLILDLATFLIIAKSATLPRY
jgi:hypothetical protein